MEKKNKYIFLLIGLVVGAVLTLAAVTFLGSSSEDAHLKTETEIIEDAGG